MPLQQRICDIEPFVAESTPQLNSPEEASSAGEIFQQQIQGYLNRLRDALCEDVQEIGRECCINYTSPAVVRSTTVDFPSIGSNSSAFVDVTVEDTPLGTHIISWAPLTDATSIDDLIVQFLIIADDTLRITMLNPSAGAINPDSITFQFITAQAEDT